MIDKSTWNVEIRRQGGTKVNMEIPVNAGDVERNGMLLSLGQQTEGDVCIPVVESPERITAFYLFNPWRSRPAFADSLADILDKTQIALFKMKERTICLRAPTELWPRLLGSNKKESF